MKTVKFLAVLVLLAVSTILNAQETNSDSCYYYGFVEKIELQKIIDKVLVKTKPSVVKNQYEQAIKSRMSTTKTEWQSQNICKIELSVNENIEDLLTDDEVVSVRNCYKTDDGFEFGLSDEIIVKFKSDIKDSDKEKILIGNSGLFFYSV